MSLILEKRDDKESEELTSRLNEKEDVICTLRRRIEEHKKAEAGLKNYIEAMQKDLGDALERAEVYKIARKREDQGSKAGVRAPCLCRTTQKCRSAVQNDGAREVCAAKVFGQPRAR